MPTFPSPKKDVTRARVPTVVKGMLRNPLVGDVDCIEQLDHNYTVNPRRRIPPPPVAAPSPRRKKKSS
ncbi:MAG: hypothetical protein IPM29_03415 [Planctomycetes bacterium]|nr:hypothetical protein [Planctomycetota bacterium]